MGVDQHEPVFQFYQETKEYQLCKENLDKAQWIMFMEKFKGYHDGISHAFTHFYDGKNVYLGGLQLKTIEYTIEEATRLLDVGEKYFKGASINKELCQKFLKPEHLNLDWTKCIPRNWIKEEYMLMINSFQIFLTCEGRYAVTFLYHLRLLLHFEGGPK